MRTVYSLNEPRLSEPTFLLTKKTSSGFQKCFKNKGESRYISWTAYVSIEIAVEASN